jgi:hypothetical protein
MNAVPDETSVNALLDSNNFASSISYGTATAYTSTSSGARNLQIEPTGATTAIINTTITLNSGGSFTVVATNYSTGAAAVTLTDDLSAPTSGNMKLRIVNAAPGLGTADVYVVAPGTDITGVTATASSLAFESASAYLTIPAGSYDVLFTLPGQKFAFIDSGSLSWSAGQIRTLVSLNGQSGGFTTTVLADLN